MLSFALMLLSKSKQLTESFRADINFWYEVVDREASTKGKNAFKDVLRAVFTEFAQPN